jgi:putative nucleotidyltransferase with HDIG domain
MNDTRTPAFQFLKDIAADLARGAVTFPTFSQATIKVRTALEEPDIDADRLGKVVSTEPLLAARLVAMANSAALNPGGRSVGDVRSAILRVGIASVRSVAVALALQQLRDGSQSASARPFAEATWRHSVQVAAIAFVLAKRLSRINPDEALFAGLVHDIGHFYLLSQAARYPELEHNAEELAQILASWHTSIGQAVLHEFHVSDALMEAVGEHENGHFHSPPRSLTDLVTIANIAASRTNPVVSLRVDPATLITQRDVVDALNDARQEIVALASVLRG